MLNIGNNNVTGLYIGSSPVTAVYIGTEQIYPNGEVVTGVDYGDWTYAEDMSYRTRDAKPWTALKLPDGTIVDKEYGETYEDKQDGTLISYTYTYTYSATVNGSRRNNERVWGYDIGTSDEVRFTYESQDVVQIKVNGVATQTVRIPASGGTHDLKDTDYFYLEVVVLNTDNVTDEQFNIPIDKYTFTYVDVSNSTIESLLSVNYTEQTATIASRGTTVGVMLEGFVYVNISIVYPEKFSNNFAVSYNSGTQGLVISIAENKIEHLDNSGLPAAWNLNVIAGKGVPITHDIGTYLSNIRIAFCDPDDMDDSMQTLSVTYTSGVTEMPNYRQIMDNLTLTSNNGFTNIYPYNVEHPSASWDIRVFNVDMQQNQSDTWIVFSLSYSSGSDSFDIGNFQLKYFTPPISVPLLVSSASTLSPALGMCAQLAGYDLIYSGSNGGISNTVYSTRSATASDDDSTAWTNDLTHTGYSGYSEYTAIPYNNCTYISLNTRIKIVLNTDSNNNLVSNTTGATTSMVPWDSALIQGYTTLGWFMDVSNTHVRYFALPNDGQTAPGTVTITNITPTVTILSRIGVFKILPLVLKPNDTYEGGIFVTTDGYLYGFNMTSTSIVQGTPFKTNSETIVAACMITKNGENRILIANAANQIEEYYYNVSDKSFIYEQSITLPKAVIDFCIYQNRVICVCSDNETFYVTVDGESYENMPYNVYTAGRDYSKIKATSTGSKLIFRTKSGYAKVVPLA